MIKFQIQVNIQCDDFMAESEEDARECLEEALQSLGYGLNGCYDIYTVRVNPYQGD